jgi:hypothetical protein
MAIKTSEKGYIIIKRYDLYQEKAIPTGALREDNGVTQAEFFLITGDNPERKVWLSRQEIM